MKKLSDKKRRQLLEILKSEPKKVADAVINGFLRDFGMSPVWNERALQDVTPIIKDLGSKDLPKKLLDIFKSACIRKELFSIITDTEFLKRSYSQGMPLSEKKGIAIALRDDTAFLEKILMENPFAVCDDIVHITNNIHILELFKQYATGYYKSRINERLKKMPKSVRYTKKIAENQIDRYQPDPELSKEFAETLKAKLGEKNYLQDFEKFLGQVNVNNKQKETLRFLIKDLKEL